MHKILIQLPGCNEFTEKFPGGSPAAAKELADIRYPNALRIEWKGTCLTDEQENAARAREALWERETQEHYARQSAQTATHQTPYVASERPVSASGGGGGGGCGAIALMVLFAPIAILGAVFGGDNDVAPTATPAAPTTEYASPADDWHGITSQNCSRFLTATECAAEFGTDRSATPVDLQEPCAIWADANPTLAAQLTPADTCFGF